MSIRVGRVERTHPNDEKVSTETVLFKTFDGDDEVLLFLQCLFELL